ncbi:hypothetical protein MVI27_02645 [Chryseobacterium salipaludis]|uniref:hypothetical protein n=1 Tax=Chryseobacterium TaxID=59732 RepID=UPI001FF2A245|nr:MULTISPECIES: hypothetical protein [Chryseobacterium]MCJ8497152.1 hypothetical protein [Chryseobacterium salipaludis]MCX3296634.1 hypothetical protein [Planobacterium sp. JC490]
MLEGKNILIISVQFFNYENLIKSQLETMGATVDLFDERPSNTFFTKAIIRIKKEFIKKKINQHFKSIIQKIKQKKYDYFLLIKGEVTPAFFLDFLRSNYPQIHLIYYTYDSIKNNSNGLSILHYFDSKFTFDNYDALQYKMKFRPLFFSKDYQNLSYRPTVLKYDVVFIGTAHSDRYTISEKVRQFCQKHKLKMFCFYFSPSKTLFKFKQLTDTNFKGFDIKKVSFTSLTHNQIIDLYADSKAILDINHPGQNGLTMRTFETLGAGRKLITTNPEVRNYSFYDPQNISIIDRSKVVVEDSFFKTEFKPIDEETINRMSLEGWIKEVFELTSPLFLKPMYRKK